MIIWKIIIYITIKTIDFSWTPRSNTSWGFEGQWCSFRIIIQTLLVTTGWQPMLFIKDVTILNIRGSPQGRWKDRGSLGFSRAPCGGCSGTKNFSWTWRGPWCDVCTRVVLKEILAVHPPTLCSHLLYLQRGTPNSAYPIFNSEFPIFNLEYPIFCWGPIYWEI